MSIWGSLIGGFVGFSFAGPIGALIGSMVGGRISSARRSGFQRSFAPPQQVFAIALIILTAKLAKALDGKLPIIGVGGINSKETAAAKIEAGASLVQVYSGFIYEGPSLIKNAAEGVNEARRALVKASTE